MERVLSWMFLSMLTDWTNKKLRSVLALTGDPEELFRMSASDVEKAGISLTEIQKSSFEAFRDEEKLARLFEANEKKGIHFYAPEDERFPQRLLAIDDPVFGLYVKGKLPEEERRAVSIVGSRSASPYGLRMTEFFANSLAKRGISVISGMALGIDAQAQRSAVFEEGGSYAVLGGGVDICYPRENVELYKNLSERGGIISERPVGYYPKAYDFPLRNRIVSGLSDCLLLMEGAQSSGSMITAKLALSQGKEVFSLPGRVGDRVNEGCNQMIKDGAQVLLSPEDVLSYFGMTVGENSVSREKPKLSEEESIVYRAISEVDTHIEEIFQKTGLPISVLPELLLGLQIKGLVKKEVSGGYSRV